MSERVRVAGAVVVLGALVALAALAGRFPYGPTQVRTEQGIEALRPPSAAHWLGTDDRGRDVATRLAFGARTSLAVAVGALVLSLVLGLGAALAASAAGWLDVILVGACDLVGAVPALLLVVAAQGLFGRATLVGVVVLVAVPRAADVARLARAELRRAMAAPFVEAARVIGAGRARVVWRHALPQIVPQMAVACAITVSTAILAEAALGFVGFGAPPPAPSWGELLREAQASGLKWWLAVPPGVLIAVGAMAANVLAEGRERGRTRTRTRR